MDHMDMDMDMDMDMVHNAYVLSRRGPDHTQHTRQNTQIVRRA